MSVIDGANRILSCVKASEEAKREGIDLSQEGFSVNIYNLTEKQAQSLIHQEGKGNKIDENLLKSYNQEDKYINIAKEINSYESLETNSLYNMMGKDTEEVNKFNKYCLISTFAEGIEDNFNDVLAIPRDIEKVKEYLVKFFNEFTGIFHHFLEKSKISDTRNNTVIADNVMFIGYLKLARELYGNKDWKTLLELSVSDIVWDKTNSQWKNIKAYNLNKSTKTFLYDYFGKLAQSHTLEVV
jgi:hypothetical protein